MYETYHYMGMESTFMALKMFLLFKVKSTLTTGIYLSNISEPHWYDIPDANHGAGIFTYIYPQKSPSYVGQYTSTMKHLGVLGPVLGRSGLKLPTP